MALKFSRARLGKPVSAAIESLPSPKKTLPLLKNFPRKVMESLPLPALMVPMLSMPMSPVHLLLYHYHLLKHPAIVKKRSSGNDVVFTITRIYKSFVLDGSVVGVADPASIVSLPSPVVKVLERLSMLLLALIMSLPSPVSKMLSSEL
jgi:hypothetical protein